MGKSLIISSTTKEFIYEQLRQFKNSLNISEQNGVDLLEITSENLHSISIGKTRILKAWSLTKPYFSEHKLAVIYDAHLLTTEAQNSLLKILEEPNESLNIVLTTNKHELLLPTVISRCELILFSGPFEQLSEAGNGDFSAEAQSNHIDRLLSDLIEIQRIFLEIKKQNKKEQFRTIDEFLISRILDQRQSMLHGNSQEKALQNIQLVHETKKMLESKVNTRLALENLVINFTR
ncbi:MAG TPA: hypothetical protein VJC17_02065 [Candidatus Dojkabacteria bacterium]|nr:hypothetical protein [Candidatus Dojkabacteria bacterium]